DIRGLIVTGVQTCALPICGPAPVEPTRSREHAAYRLDEPVRQRIGRPDPPSLAAVAEPPRDDPHDERGDEDSVRHDHREHHRPPRPLVVRGCPPVTGAPHQVPKREEQAPGDRHPAADPPPRVPRVAPGPPEPPFEGPDRWA